MPMARQANIGLMNNAYVISSVSKWLLGWAGQLRGYLGQSFPCDDFPGLIKRDLAKNCKLCVQHFPSFRHCSKPILSWWSDKVGG